MKGTITLFFFVVVSCCCGYAQNKLTDSLQKLLAVTTDDTLRVIRITELGLQFRNTNVDSSIYYGQKALALAKQIQFRRGEVIALSNIGIAMRERGDLPEALELQIKALQIAEANNYIIESSFCLRRIGLVYMDIRDYPNALNYLHQSLHRVETVQFKRGMAIEYMNLGMTHEYMGQLDSALYYIQKAQDGKDDIEDLFPEVNRVFGNIYAKKENPQLAMSYYRIGIDAGAKLNDFRTISFICADAARMFKQMNQPDSIIAYAKKSLRNGQMASYQKGILFSSTILSEYYDSINPEEALYYYKIAAAAKDSLFGAGNIQTIQTLVSKEEARQKEVQQAKLIYQNRLKQYGLIAGLGVFLVIAIILYRNNWQKQKANLVLRQQKEEIAVQKNRAEKTLDELKATQQQLIQSEKMASLGELTAGIAHEIQNPLNFVNNFSEVNQELVDELLQELKAGRIYDAISISNNIKENEERINHHGKRADAIVKGMLQHSQTGTGVKEPADINALCDEYLRMALHGWKAKDKNFNAGIETTFDESLSADQAGIGEINIIPQDIGKVLLNVYNNAFYAVNERKKQSQDSFEPTISVTTKKLENKIIISVKDNGNGIPQKIVDKIFQPFFTTKPTGSGTGLGLSLSYDIIRAHGGEIKVKTVPGEGAEFVIILPLNS